MANPLRGILVVDISRLLPGGVTSLLLRESGARVIKVEQPGVGDYYRAVSGAADFIGSGQFGVINQGKESLGLDLKKPQGREIFLKLVRRADVVLESFRPGTLARLGLGEGVLKKGNRRLILASITGAGYSGGEAKLAGHDLNYMALAGLAAMNRSREGEPVVPEFQMVDLATAIEAARRVEEALFVRQRSGRGSRVKVSMLETAMKLARIYAPSSSRFTREWMEKSRYGVYAGSDGRWVALAALEPKFWKAFRAAVGDRGASDLPALFRSRSRDEWARLGERADCCLTPVREVDEISFPSPRRSPRLGEHSGKILRSLGFRYAQIRQLRKEGIIA